MYGSNFTTSSIQRWFWNASAKRFCRMPGLSVCLVAIESAADRLPLLECRAIEKGNDTKCPLQIWEGHGSHTRTARSQWDLPCHTKSSLPIYSCACCARLTVGGTAGEVVAASGRPIVAASGWPIILNVILGL